MTSPTMQNLHTLSLSPENISILLVSPFQDDQAALRRILQHVDWKIARVSAVAEAVAHLKSNPASLVICERDLPDGNWKDILHQSSEIKDAPLLLVISRHADENLWAEVLNLGGYDVLLKPFDRSEVTRVIGMAWRHWWSNWNGKRSLTTPLSMLA